MREQLKTFVARAATLAVLLAGSAAFFPPALAQTAPNLLTAGPFAVLGAATVTNTGPSIVLGNLGVGPGTAITGFNTFPGVNRIVGPGTVTVGLGLVNGIIHAGSNPAFPQAAAAHADAGAAYLNLRGQACPPANTFGTVAQLGGLRLAPGVYCFPSSANVTGTLTLDGPASGVWVFQIVSTLVTGTNAQVLMTGGATSSNVFWAVGSSATLGAGTRFSGNIIADQSIALTAGANVSGRALALVGAVTMDTNFVANRSNSLPAPGTRPGVSQILLDHFQCYEAKPTTRVTPPRVDLVDQFGTKTRIKVGSPSLICAPTVKNHNPPSRGPALEYPDDLRNPIDHLVCYDLPASKAQKGKDDDNNDDDNNDDGKKHAGKTTAGNTNTDILVSVDNQFGLNKEFTVKKPKMLCVPSLKERL